MCTQQPNEHHSLPEERYPADVGVEIADLLEHGWTWVGDRLTHPNDKELWRTYDLATNQCTPSPKLIAWRKQVFDEFVRATKEARNRFLNDGYRPDDK